MAASLLEETMRADVQAEKVAEILELKAMIVALREQMEALSFSKDAAVQKAVQRSADEIQQLKNTASSLRNELENLRFEKDAAVQQTAHRSADEIQQLKNTVKTLRKRIENHDR